MAVNDALLEAAGPTLRVVANFAVGYDNVDLDACRRRGVAVTNTPDVLTNATAELALALSLAAARHMSEAEADLRGGRWRGFDPGAYLGLELTGATFGVVGMGRIGRRYAELVRGLAGEILYTSRTRKQDAERELGVRQVSLADILERADVVSLHLPATAETTGLIGARELATMKPRGAPGQHFARVAGRLEGAGPGAARRGDRRGGPRRVRARARRPDRAARGAPLCAVAPHRLRHHAIAQRHGPPGRRQRSRRASGH